MQLTAVERLLLLKLTQILKIIDPANARQLDADAQALELGTPAVIETLPAHRYDAANRADSCSEALVDACSKHGVSEARASCLP